MPTPPAGSGECCLPNAEGITFLKIGDQCVPVGMLGLDQVFQQLVMMERRPEDTADTELVGMARKFNYIPGRESVEADYASALRQAYALYCERQEKNR